MKRKFLLIILILSQILLSAETDMTPDIHHNPWELIIYRPQNTANLNDIRCWVKLEDMDGNDVTYTAAKATYEWASEPNKVNKYQKTYWLSGGVAMHLNLKPGKYKITVSTPSDKQWPYPSENRDQWTSNEFLYNTENPAKVIFVYPSTNNNGFYNGKWIISHLAPKYFKQATIPVMEE